MVDVYVEVTVAVKVIVLLDEEFDGRRIVEGMTELAPALLDDDVSVDEREGEGTTGGTTAPIMGKLNVVFCFFFGGNEEGITTLPGASDNVVSFLGAAEMRNSPSGSMNVALEAVGLTGDAMLNGATVDTGTASKLAGMDSGLPACAQSPLMTLMAVASSDELQASLTAASDGPRKPAEAQMQLVSVRVQRVFEMPLCKGAAYAMHVRVWFSPSDVASDNLQRNWGSLRECILPE